MWKGRFRENTARVVQDFTQSLDIDWFLAPYDIQGSVAHARMLVSAGLLAPDEGEAIEEALVRIGKEISSGEFTPSEELEDVHMNIEHRLIELLGGVGAKLHTGRSRNDQVAVTVRLYLRDRLLHIAEDLDGLLAVLLGKAEEHLRVIIPGYTHLQQAQPISLGHYWMAHFEAFSRDRRRLLFALESLEDCPLGAGALAGSTLPLDRFATASELSFARPSDNSLDSVAQRDYMADYHSFASLFAVHCSRLAEDFVIYSSREFGWLILPDAFCTGSSMMPQKKNPDVLELLRGKTGQIVGHYFDLLMTLKGLPMTYDRDLQEDKRGLRRSLATLEGMLKVLAPLLVSVKADGPRAEEGMADGFALATDVAEYLVLRGIPFREAHAKVGGVVKECLARKKGLFDLTQEEWRELLPEGGEDLLPLLTLRSSVERRRTWGGTSFSRVQEQIDRGKTLLESSRGERDQWRNAQRGPGGGK